MLQNMKLAHRLLLIFGIVLLIVFAAGLLGLHQIRMLGDLTTRVHRHALYVNGTLQEIHSTLLKAHVHTTALISDATIDPSEIGAAEQLIRFYEQKVRQQLDSLKQEESRFAYEIDAVRTALVQWRSTRSHMLKLLKEGRQGEIDQNTLNRQQTDLEDSIQNLIHQARIQTDSYLETAQAKERYAYRAASAGLVILSLFVAGTGLLLARSIIQPIKAALTVAEQVADGNLHLEFDTSCQVEIGQLLRAFAKILERFKRLTKRANAIVQGDYSQEDLLIYGENDELGNAIQQMMIALKASKKTHAEQNWRKDGLNKLNEELSGELALAEVCQKALTFIARYSWAGHGVLYVYDATQERLKLYSSFAFTERDSISNTYKLGEGVIGQVALERSPILLRNISRENTLITTGTVNEAPLNTYTFPLVYNNSLYGVLELASFTPFTQTTQDFLQEANPVVATAIFSTIQREHNQELLRLSRQKTQEAEQASEAARQKAKEVQEANMRLEEQQQELEQQSEELQQANAQLEEHEQQLRQQSEELRQQNESLTLAKEQLIRRARELDQASKYKSEFLANMSHELRTPLNSIILLSKMLERNDRQTLDDKALQQIHVIHQAGQELLRLINDVLDLSKIEAGKMTVHIVEFSIDDLLEEFQGMFQAVADDKGLDFQVEPTGQNLQVQSDRDKLSQIVRNLLSNALKFTKEGSVSLAASVHQDNQFQLTVKDTGIGIAQEKQQLIFEAFQQVDSSISREFGGTGLGLSISREYIKLLHGTMTLNSSPNQGTTFTLTFPLAWESATSGEHKIEIALNRADTAREEATVQETTIEDDRGQLRPTDTVILLIEDNADFGYSMMSVIRKMGHKVLLALQGQEGLALASQVLPTGILLDVMLPDINGMEVLRELKRTKELRHIPVHIISSAAKDSIPNQSEAVGYFQKPVNELDIQRAVENLLRAADFSPKRLLVVEDEDIQREALQELLSDIGGVEITGVSSQAEALREIESGKYDAAIIDLGLTDGTGHAICHYIRDQRKALPVIIYTGKELDEDEERDLRTCAESIIIKTTKSFERLQEEVALFLRQTPRSISGLRCAAPDSQTPLAHHYTGSLQDRKILIVDDDMKNVFVLTAALENNDAHVMNAPNGKEALELLRQEPDVDLVLMDIMMPVMDGYEAIRQIRQDASLKHLPIIALTAKALKDDRQKCIQAGANDYLSKPIDYDGLIRLAQAWIDKETV